MSSEYKIFRKSLSFFTFFKLIPADKNYEMTPFVVFSSNSEQWLHKASQTLL